MIINRILNRKINRFFQNLEKKRDNNIILYTFRIESNKFELDNKIFDIREIIIIIVINLNLFSIKLFFIHNYFIS